MYRACSLLATENLKIREIAEKLEFTNEFYFSRFFKKHSGMAPAQFRKEKFRL
jgi:YesN/AraC family two-component response regulator